MTCGLPCAVILHAAKQWTTLRILVRDRQGRPVARASVIVRPLKGKRMKPKKGSALELKTSHEGSTPVPPLPRGHVLIQVISEGYRTHGERVALTEPEQTQTIILEPPTNQVSVHKQ